jgi:hypothetical protein
MLTFINTSTVTFPNGTQQVQLTASQHAVTITSAGPDHRVWTVRFSWSDVSCLMQGDKEAAVQFGRVVLTSKLRADGWPIRLWRAFKACLAW